MTPKLPIKQNSAGRWIYTATGRFAKKSDYLPYLERKLKANAARSASVKDYWDSVKVVMKVNNITDVTEGRSKLKEEVEKLKHIYSELKSFTKDPMTQKRYTIKNDQHARKLLMATEKYKDDSNKISYHDLWERFRREKADKARRKEIFSQIEQDQTELVS